MTYFSYTLTNLFKMMIFSAKKHSIISFYVAEKVSVRNRRQPISEDPPEEKPDQQSESRQEDRENKGPLSGKSSNRTPRIILEETNTTRSGGTSVAKLRKRVRVESSGDAAEVPTNRPVRRRTTRLDKVGESKSSEDTVADIPKKPGRRKSLKQQQLDEDDVKKDLTEPLLKRLRAVPERLKKEFKAETSDEPEEDEQESTSPPPPRVKVEVKEEPVEVKVEPEETKDVKQEVEKDTPEATQQSAEVKPESDAVLERLSPPVADGRLLLHQQAEQERSRHNDSPVILVEKLGKPLPAYHYPHHGRFIGEHQQQHLGRSGPGDDATLMEVEGAGAVLGGPSVGGVLSAASALRAAAGNGGGIYGDSSSDSGVSSLRSAGSGDERSGSRSSALSAEDTSAITAPPPATPARVWHVQSVQHSSLMMAHPPASSLNPASAAAAAAAAANLAAPVGYPGSAAAVAAAAAAAAHHHPGLAPEMLWRPSSRYLPIPPGLPGQPSLTEVLERERQERMLR